MISGPMSTGKKAPTAAPITPNKILMMKTDRLPRSTTAAIPPKTMPMSSMSMMAEIGKSVSQVIEFVSSTKDTALEATHKGVDADQDQIIEKLSDFLALSLARYRQVNSQVRQIAQFAARGRSDRNSLCTSLTASESMAKSTTLLAFISTISSLYLVTAAWFA